MAERHRSVENLVMDGTFWKGKRVLMTGHTGFKGSWLSLWLQSHGAQLVGYSLPPPTQPNLFEAARVGEGMISIEGDVRDPEHLREVIGRHRPEILIHMAAQPLVRYSYVHPVETYSVNVMGTVHVLEAVRQSDSVRVVLIITSDKCYENREWIWGYRETDPVGGYDPYSSSKACTELVVSAYRTSYFSEEKGSDQAVSIATTRAGNVIGGGDWAKDRLIPDIINAFVENRTPLIRYPHAVRPWQHVLEPLHGYLGLAERLWYDGAQFGGAWNFGPDEEDATPVCRVVDRLAAFWGEGSQWNPDSLCHPHEATYLKLDCSKARSLLGWRPKLRLDTALAWVAEWYRAYYQGGDMHRLTQSQIRRYEHTL